MNSLLALMLTIDYRFQLMTHSRPRWSQMTTDIMDSKHFESMISSHLFAPMLHVPGHIAAFQVWSWWRHQMETFSALLALCAGNSLVPVNSPYRGQWRGALMFSLICARINDWVNNREAGDLRRHRGHYDVNVMMKRGGTSVSRKASSNQISRNLVRTHSFQL